MNLLCDYENYLRDRYILGQPVRYMYGGFGDASSGASASQSKQKIYGPDGNEYTYIDDPTSPNAGRYYRNVGGPGGGRIVFLDEVQEASQKRQMEDANKAAQPKETEARQPKRGVRKKEKLNPERKITFNPDASYEELLEKHYPDGNQVVLSDLGYTPEYRRNAISLSDIARAIESNDLTFFDNVRNPVNFNDVEEVVLQDRDGNKLRFTNFELFEFIKERLEDNNPDEPYQQGYNNVDDVLYGYKWVKLPRELRSEVDGKNKARQINRGVSEAILVLNDFAEDIGNISKYDEVPSNLLTGLVDCYLGIEKTAPHHDDSFAAKKVFLSRVNNFLAGVSLAKFLVNNEDSPARDTAVGLIEKFLEAALSKTPSKKLGVIYDKAKELGFTPYINPDPYNSYFTPADYSEPKRPVEESPAQEPEPKNVISRDVETTAPEAAETDASQFPEPSPTVQESKPSVAKKRAKEEREAKHRAKEEQKASGDAPKKKRGKKASNVPTAQEVVESETATLERAPFDVSGLGLPGSQDSVLDAKEGDNRDAAYFIRRDLEATTKGATDSRQLQDNQHIQDDNGRSKENRGAESSKSQDVSQATRHTAELLPELKGSKSQVEQANKIRDRVYNWALYTSYFDNGTWMEYNSAEKDFYDLVSENSDLYADEALRRFFSENDSARFWIDNEKDIRSVLYLYLRRAVPNILKEGWRPTQENREDVDRRRREAKKLLDTKRDDPNTYRKKALPQFEEAKKVRRVAEQASGIDSREEALKTAKQLKSLAYYAATKGDIETVTICRDVVANLNKKFGQGEYDQLQEWEEMLGRTHTRASNNAEKKRVKEEREKKRAAKKPVKNERGSSDVGTASASSPRDETEYNDAASLVRRDLDEASKEEVKDDVREVAQVSETPSITYPKRDDDAALEIKVSESLAQGEPLRKKATRLRSKAKEAALKGRKDEAAELRRQADEIEVEARGYIDEAVNAGVELKNRRAQALPSSEERPAEETRATVSTKQLSPNEKTEEIPYWRSYMLRFEKEARTVPEGMAYSVIGSLWNGGMALNARGDFKFATRARDALVGLSKRLAGDNASVARRRANALSESIERAKRYREKYGQPLLSPTQSPQSAIKNPAENSVQAQPVVSEQQTNSVSEPTQEQPAKPRPERWTPLKSKMNDDDKRVVENTRKRLNYGLSELAWRLGNAKEKGDVQRVKQLVATAANHYLEQARRAYRSHGGTEALAAFDEALGGNSLTVGQLRDRVVDKFRKIAQMEANDLFKFAGERLDEFESFAETDREPIANKKIHLNSIRDKNGKWEDLDDKDSEVTVEDGKPSTLFPDEHFGRRMGSERGLADAVRRALKSMTRKGEYRDSFENGAEYAVPKYNIDTPTRMGRFLAHGYKDSLDGKPVSRDDYSEQRYQELLKKFPTDRESRKLNDLFNSNNREVNKLIKENEDEYKRSKNKSGVVQRVVDGIRDLLSEGRQNGSVEAPPSESLRNGTASEVLETGGTDRLSDGGDGRHYTSIIAEEAKKSDVPESRVREELSLSTNKGQEKARPSSANSPENMTDWERELEKMREFKLLEDPILTRSNKRGSSPNASQNVKATKAPPVASSGDKTGTSTQVPGKGVSQTPSFIHTPTIQQRIDAYVAEQRAKGRNIESLTAEDYAKIFPDEGQRTNEGQTTVPKNKRGRPRIMRPDADNTKKASKKKRKS